MHGGDINDNHHAREVCLDSTHVQLINSEEECVKQRYFAVARTLAPEGLRIARKQAADMLGISKRQFQRILKRFMEQGIEGLIKTSTRPKRFPNKIPEDVERRIVEVRKATGFGPDRTAVIVNKGLEIEGRKRVSDATCYNVLVRNGLVEAEKRAQKEYRSFE